MSFLLDTDICSAHLKGDGRVFNRFMQHSGGLNVSILTLAELYSWVSIADGVARTRREDGLATLMSDVTILPIDRSIAALTGQVRADLQRQGIRVAMVDLLIAVTALQHDLTVVTHNARHFNLVPGIRVEDRLA